MYLVVSVDASCETFHTINAYLPSYTPVKLFGITVFILLRAHGIKHCTEGGHNLLAPLPIKLQTMVRHGVV